MENRYIADLSLLKSTFDRKNEANIIAEAIARHFTSGNLSILDVGIGEGRAIIEVAEYLTVQGYDVELTGIDLHISNKLRKQAPNNFNLIEKDFFTYAEINKFCVVITTQTLFYLGDVVTALHKLVKHLSTNGCLIITLWTSRCSLFHFHQCIKGSENAITTCAETVTSDLRVINPNATIELVRSVGKIKIEQWRDSDRICRAAYNILARSSQTHHLSESGFQNFKEYLQSLPSEMKRENGTIIFKSSCYEETT